MDAGHRGGPPVAGEHRRPAEQEAGDPDLSGGLGCEPAAGQRPAAGWNAVWPQEGTRVTAANAAWSGRLGPGASVDLGFNGTWSGADPAPEAFTLNGADWPEHDPEHAPESTRGVPPRRCAAAPGRRRLPLWGRRDSNPH
ncbi:cellulose binding domain-containing protein [Streptomonospora nanhaiensis]|uniref:cellulose binding domain-containing protein n=1 Tax=Streptomonospora nanhaiensis TaxID=1323731 RepID=UPI0027E26FED|nr:cellulose binding domain-containing protein [Streptomonospora nanhaiensis]